MAGNTVPVSGHFGDIYILRPNGFVGTGSNDLTWGAASSESDSSYFEVEIDGVGTGSGGVDTFRWRENGGSWTSTVDIVAGGQNLVGTNMTQAITSWGDDGTGTPHTSGDKWVIGTLYNEACSESTTTAQITDTTLRVINPNAPPTWTDTNSETLLQTDFTRGWTNWSANVGTVTVSGDNGVIIPTLLQEVGYIQGWTLYINVGTHDVSRMQQKYTEHIQGILSANGSFEQLFLSSQKMLDTLKDTTNKYIYVRLFTYDPSGDQSGDYYAMWATITSLGEAASVSSVIRSNIGFNVFGYFTLSVNYS